MSKTAAQVQFEDILPGVRQPARYIGDESGTGPGFSGAPGELRVVIGFPDTYEIGISNQAVQILYHLARETAGVGVERTYLPWVDAIEAMRRKGVPLLTIESWAPVASADLVGLTLQHEFNYTNVLELLDLAVLPIHAADRGEDQPLVIAGGPSCANFVPLAPFFDAITVGDGEEIFPDILRVLREAKLTGAPRAERRRRLSEIEGVYVPGVSRTARRRVAARLEGAPYPSECLVPLTSGVHDRAWVEVMRGCTRGCRFCQAGMWYRPVRERPPAEVREMAAAQLASSGHQELAVASLSTTDYSCLTEVLATMAEEHPEVRISLPSLRVDTAAVRLAHVVSPTGPSLTLAPEAGSEHMWNVINKNIGEADVVAAAQEAFRTGRTTLKLYFMIGFPLEEDADVEGIAELCLKIREFGREMLGDRRNRLQLNVGVNNFIPKPFTPFQWLGMADRATLRRRQELLRSRLKRPGIRLTLHGVDKSFLEAALSRGGETMAAVVEAAWRKGARFDSWTEQFREDAWRQALEEAGTSAEELATTPLPIDQLLPWDIIEGVVEHEFLWEEWQKAQRGELTPDCRWDACGACGACEGAPVLAQTGSRATGPSGQGGDRPAATRTAPAPADPSVAAPERPRLRYLVVFSVTGRGRYIGHLDRTEILRRGVRRAGGRLALSQGMRPKPVLSLALPLAVGVEGLHELGEFALAEEPPEDFFERLSRALPAHMKLLDLKRYDAARSLPARVIAADYEVRVRPSLGGSAADTARPLQDAVERFFALEELPIEEMREGTLRRVDVRRFVESISIETGEGTIRLCFRTAVTPFGTARPEHVVKALGALAGVGLEIEGITRTQVLLS